MHYDSQPALDSLFKRKVKQSRDIASVTDCQTELTLIEMDRGYRYACFNLGRKAVCITELELFY